LQAGLTKYKGSIAQTHFMRSKLPKGDFIRFIRVINMKNSILLLGFIASAGLSFANLPFSRASASEPQSSVTTAQKNWTQINYTATDEDGNKEDVKTGKKGK
jgi:hypothetical protein